jgi:hypothetical protein
MVLDQGLIHSDICVPIGSNRKTYLYFIEAFLDEVG